MSKSLYSPFKRRLHDIIFEADTSQGKAFDVALFVAIIASVIIVALETVDSVNDKYGTIFKVLEYAFTIFFTVEYMARLYCSYKPMKYAISFYGIIDLLSILPTYLIIFIGGGSSLMFIRSLRLLRVFRVFKLVGFLNESAVIVTAMKASRTKIIIFMYFIVIVVSIFGSLMYLIEGSLNSGFDSIPRSIYWAIVTLTTVGYGDISPVTSFGQFVSSVIMILGYAVIAVPTGIVSSEMIKQSKRADLSTQVCQNCHAEGHDKDAIYCKFCGHKINP